MINFHWGLQVSQTHDVCRIKRSHGGRGQGVKLKIINLLPKAQRVRAKSNYVKLKISRTSTLFSRLK